MYAVFVEASNNWSFKGFVLHDEIVSEVEEELEERIAANKIQDYKIAILED